MFIDEIKIYSRAGHGGPGCIAFQREKYRPKGGPSGGNGGRGGDVILEADHDLNNLIQQYYQPRLIAQEGEAGKGKGMDGHAGKDLLVKVPCGTLVWKLSSEGDPQGPGSRNAADSAQRPRFRTNPRGRALEIDFSSNEPEESAVDTALERELVADLTVHGQRFILCKGGRGGLGNRNFATAARQTPRFAQPGEAGDEGNFQFELRTVADVGIVGYPNAGKSTLLTAISQARPKIAPYPFTTLHPQIGIVEYSDFARITACDVPGLIEGAHQNIGLGHKFLRHIQRCKLLVVLLDMAGVDGRAPWDDYTNLLKELELFDASLLERPRLVLANKMDEAIAEANLAKFKRRIRKVQLLPVAAAFDQGIEKFKNMIRSILQETGDKMTK
jgi:GTP-binding protein